jgi:pimeloyl-ACP methyl ester carboxylesterase
MRGEFVDVGGARLYYYAAGTRSPGVPLVLVHGFPTSGHLWREMVPLLPQGRRAVVVDLLGYGRSDPPGTANLDVAAHADRLLGLMDALGIGAACVVGHGLGGVVAQSLAVRFPERVSALCLVSAPLLDARPALTSRVGRELAPLGRALPPSWLQSALRAALHRGYMNASEASRALELYTRPFGGPDGRTVLIRHVRALGARNAAPVGGRIACPTAVVWGRHDPFLAVSAGERLCAAIPGATLDVLASARHFVPEDTPAALAAVVAGLTGR